VRPSRERRQGAHPVAPGPHLDRLLHHSITVNIRGDGYRLKEKMKAGLLKSKAVAAAEAE
jgi:hypothetical protein